MSWAAVAAVPAAAFHASLCAIFVSLGHAPPRQLRRTGLRACQLLLLLLALRLKLTLMQTMLQRLMATATTLFQQRQLLLLPPVRQLPRTPAPLHTHMRMPLLAAAE